VPPETGAVVAVVALVPPVELESVDEESDDPQAPRPRAAKVMTAMLAMILERTSGPFDMRLRRPGGIGSMATTSSVASHR
jgi:hypothetical protein